MAKEIHRRRFIRDAGALAAATFLVPAWVTGCSSDDGTPATTGAAQKNEAWEARAGELEKAGSFTKEAPGKWAGKEATHVPSVTFNAADGTATVKTSHVMTAEHYITTQYLKDQNGVVIGLHELSPTDKEPLSVFELPPGTTKVTAFSYCNQHDAWESASAAPS